MKLFRYVILILLLCNVPHIVLVGYGDFMGSLLSYITIGLMLAYYLISKKHKPAWPFVIFAISFFIISGLVGVDDEYYFITDFLKYVILIVAGSEIALRTSSKELYYILLIGASSILINAIAFSDDYGRYSGFYLDPNSAGFVCILGVALSFSLLKEKWKLIGLSFFTFCGLLTFSRTFFLVWIIIILISAFQNKKNLKYLVLGVSVVLILVSFATIFKLNTERFNMVDNMINHGIIANEITEDSRIETWSLYYDLIIDAPLFGNGYQSFISDTIYDVGVHNNYLRVIGEAGIFPFFIFTGIYVFIFLKSLKSFRTKPYELLLATTLITVNMTNHNFETIHHVTFLSLWLFFKVLSKTDDKIEIDQ